MVELFIHIYIYIIVVSIRFGSDNDLVPCTCVRLCTVCIVYIYFACWCGCSALAICVRVVCMLTHHMVSNIQYRYVHVNMLEYVWFGGEQMCNTRVVHLLKHWAVYVHCLSFVFWIWCVREGAVNPNMVSNRNPMMICCVAPNIIRVLND